jgi:hypothetical protein
MIATLIGCGLRRGELLALRVDSIQLREEHWVIADLLGKAGHIRTVPIPSWVKLAVDEWKEAAHIAEGALFRSINKPGRVWGTGMTPKVLWEVVRAAATHAGIEKLAPHDLRRYAESRTMPNRCRGWSFGVELVANAINRIRHSPSESKALQKGQQVIVGLVAARLGVDRGSFGKDLFLDGEIRVQINLRCFDRFVPQPKCY